MLGIESEFALENRIVASRRLNGNEGMFAKELIQTRNGTVGLHHSHQGRAGWEIISTRGNS
jgi:hypothetical protein